MDLVSSGTIVNDVQRYTNLSFGANRKPLTLQDVRIEICESCEALSGMIRAQEFGDQYFTLNEFVTLSANVSSFDINDTLAEPFLDLKKISWLKSTTQVIPLLEAGVDDWYRNGIQPQSWSRFSPRYRVMRNAIEFYPTPVADMGIIVSYSTQLDVSPDADWSVYMANGWRRWIVTDVCRKVMIADGKSQQAQYFQSLRDDAWQQVVTSNTSRDEYGVLRVRNTESLNMGTAEFRDFMTQFGWLNR